MNTDLIAPGVVLFGRYRIEGEKPLGRGAFGVVYRATQLSTNGPRAIKVVLSGAEGVAGEIVEDYRRRFRAECGIAELVRDPNVLVVHELLEDAGMLCGVFELAEGGSVADLLLERGPPDVERALEILVEAARGLCAMHDRRFVHRDVKPSNILLTGPGRGGGRAKVADFGLAQWPAGMFGPEGVGLPLGAISSTLPHPGTREYSSPEHSDGSQPVLPTSDVYSLGCVAFEMLTGRLWKEAQREVDRCSELRPQVPGWLDEVVRRMLAEQPGTLKAHVADPARRYVEMPAVIEALEAAGRQSSEGLVQQVQRWVIRLPSGRQATRRDWSAAAARLGQGGSEVWNRLGGGRGKHVEIGAAVLVATALAAAGWLASRGRTDPDASFGTGRMTSEVLAAPSPTATQTNVPTPTATATASATATRTPTPTATATAATTATRTPRPTASATATRTPRPTASAPASATAAAARTATSTPGGRPAATRASRIAAKDRMEIVYVPAGAFLMGASDGDADASDQDKPQRKVHLNGYWIDRTEVTNAMFARFVEATGHRTTAERVGSARVRDGDGAWIDVQGAYWRRPEGGGSAVGERMEHPVVHVSWHDAKAYCEWVGRRMPTEARWEKAARGTDGRMYPWDNTAPAGNLLNYADRNLVAEWADRRADDGYERTAPVGSYRAGASPYGVLDMAGNVWEWVADRYDGGYYARAPSSNPTGPGSGNSRVLRGGSWLDDARFLRSSFRNYSSPDLRSAYLGFRCASP